MASGFDRQVLAAVAARTVPPCRIKINSFNYTRRSFAVALRARQHDHQWHARADVKERIVLRPFAFLDEVIAVIAPEDDDRFVAQAKPFERVQYVPDVVIGESRRGVISLHHFARFRFRSIAPDEQIRVARRHEKFRKARRNRMMSKRSKWRPLKSAGRSDGSWGMRLIIYLL